MVFVIFMFFLPLWSICKVKIYFSNCCQYAYEIVKSSNHQIIKSSKIRIFKYRNFWKPPKSIPDYSKWFQTTRNIILMIFLVVWHHFELSGIDFEGFQIFRSLKIMNFRSLKTRSRTCLERVLRCFAGTDLNENRSKLLENRSNNIPAPL